MNLISNVVQDNISTGMVIVAACCFHESYTTTVARALHNGHLPKYSRSATIDVPTTYVASISHNISPLP